MKKLTKSLLIAGAMVLAGNANASIVDDICPLVGIDYQQVWMGGKKGSDFDFTQAFPKSYPGGTVYLGTRFCECLGLELGYDWAAKKSRNVTGEDGDVVNTSVRRMGGHLDLIGYLPVVDCFELMGVVGVGYVSPKVRFSSDGESINASVKDKIVGRVRVGGNYMLTDCVGLRALVGWESTNRIRLKVSDGDTSKAFKSSVTASVGAFYKF